MHRQQNLYVTPQEYLDAEREAEGKSEYWHGQIYAVAGASPRHTLIAANIIISLGSRLKGRPCQVHTGDLRVAVSSTGLYTYPDVVIICGQPKYEDYQKDTLVNPTILVEVLSKSTESYDRGAKFQHYRSLESLTDYLLVSQDTATVEHRVRQPDDRWLLGIYQGLDSAVPLSSIGCELPLAEVYDKIEWPDEDAARGWLRFVKEPSESYLA
jgi:Uma2 family endonuclease